MVKLRLLSKTVLRYLNVFTLSTSSVFIRTGCNRDVSLALLRIEIFWKRSGQYFVFKFFRHCFRIVFSNIYGLQEHLPFSTIELMQARISVGSRLDESAAALGLYIYCVSSGFYCVVCKLKILLFPFINESVFKFFALLLRINLYKFVFFL